MRITLTIPGLTSGGAERVLVLLANGFAQRGHSVSVLTMSGEDMDFYTLSSQVDRTALDLRYKSPTPLHALWNTGVRIVRLRQKIRATRPDVVISFIPQMNVLSAISLLGTNLPIVVTEHCSAKRFPCGQPWDGLRQLLYPQLQQVVSVSQGVDEEFSWVPAAKRSVIYNPFLPMEPGSQLSEYPPGVDPAKKWVVAMGRLIPEKGFDLLINSFQRLANHHPDWQLLILGEGPLAAELTALRDDLQLSDRVVFTGVVNNPFPILQRAELFVLPSRTEGFPMALGEALCCGAAAIATDCSRGIRELMRDGTDGIIVPTENIAALSLAMEQLMSDETERARLAANAPDTVNRFSLDKAIDQWETLLHKVLPHSIPSAVSVS